MTPVEESRAPEEGPEVEQEPATGEQPPDQAQDGPAPEQRPEGGWRTPKARKKAKTNVRATLWSCMNNGFVMMLNGGISCGLSQKSDNS